MSKPLVSGTIMKVGHLLVANVGSGANEEGEFAMGLGFESREDLINAIVDGACLINVPGETAQVIEIRKDCGLPPERGAGDE